MSMLTEKTKDQNVTSQETISFYVAECLEFPTQGEYYENLTLEEAIAQYEKMSHSGMHGVKGIGFKLKGNPYGDPEFELVRGNRVVNDILDMIPIFRDHPLVQNAVEECSKVFLPNKGWHI